MEAVNCLRCEYKDADNGNCTAVGGFCTAVPAAHCPLLRQYLGTGMTPEQAENAKTIIESAFADDTSKAERIRKLLAADKEDRVMILSCKVGDAVWFARSAYRQGDSPIEATVTGFASYGATGELIYTTMTVEGQITRRFLEHQIGKTAFLSLEEAERALEELKNV